MRNPTLLIALGASVSAIPVLHMQQYVGPGDPLENRYHMALPMSDEEPNKRIDEIKEQREGFLYGPSLLGNSSYFPTGILGDAMVKQHTHQWYAEAESLTISVNVESLEAMKALNEAGGLKHIDDYRYLYEGLWKKSVPTGIAPGYLTNYTSDLLFSMEQLSVNPYLVKRLHPTVDKLPFMVDDSIAAHLTGLTLQSLHRQGRLFLADHSYQAKYPTVRTPQRYTAACSAYFYIHPISGDFLPLAVKTNTGADLVYTPLDEEPDWLLAKALFNMNNLFHGQIFHLANSHAVAEIVHEAALRTLSTKHPVSVLLNRSMHQAYAIRPVGESVLFNSGGFFDQSFALSSEAVRMFATEFYPTVAGRFRGNYLRPELIQRGLIECTYGPSLKSFPFYDDASSLYETLRRFMVTFVEDFYVSEELLALDHELQDWIAETTNEAHAIDFPPAPLTTRATLVDILTHLAYLNGVSHHVLNSGEPVSTSGMLPLHPSAFYKALPTEKGVKDLLPYLPPANEAVKHIGLLARFNRPQIVENRGTLVHLFDCPEILNSGRQPIITAAMKYQADMKAISETMSRRKFDSDGLSQGMPFIWRGLDPAVIPFYLSV